MEGSWASSPTQRAGGAPFCLDLSFEHQFNSSSRTLNETISKWVLLMWGVETLWGAIIIDKTTKLKIRMPMWLSMQFAWLRLACNNNKMGLCNQRKILWFLYIRLHSSSDSSTLVYIRLTFVYMTHLHSSRLRSSTLVYTRLVTCLCF